MKARDFVKSIADLCSGTRTSGNSDELRLANEIERQAMMASSAFNRGDYTQVASLESNLDSLLKQYKQRYYDSRNKSGSTRYGTSSSGGSSTGCYIATAVYGSYDCPQVWTLRRYRDEILAATWYGRTFIRVYYAVSPTIVRRFGESRYFKKFFRKKLDDMVNSLQHRGFACTPYEDRIW